MNEFVQQPEEAFQHLVVLLMVVEEKQSAVRPQLGAVLVMKSCLLWIQTSKRNVSYKDKRFNGRISFSLILVDILSF